MKDEKLRMKTLTRKEMVMKMEKMNMPPKPYRWSVRLPLLEWEK